MQRYNYEVNVPGFNANHGDCNATIEGIQMKIFNGYQVKEYNFELLSLDYQILPKVYSTPAT